MVGASVVGFIIGLVLVLLIGTLIVSAVLMPTLRIMIKDRSGFGYVFNTALPAMILGMIAKVIIAFAISSSQGIELNEAYGHWSEWPIAIALLTFFINKRHEATVLQSFLAALITQVVLFVLAIVFVAVVLGALMASSA